MLADKCYQLMDKSLLRALILIIALTLAACVFWDPARFAANTSSLQIWQGSLLIWGVCSGVTFGVGFHPKRIIWQLFFHPLPAFFILLFGLYHFFK
ncbi:MULTISPECIES: cyd operon protein YbgE [Xenorhabdus]|uniref:Cyd operon protein YbgE n=1 Tax=Xenorhabdus ehlersii TaxID=290111 RepID=A0A2D0IY30_9GAMM|nr:MULTISPECIES: cyd operon protein YbgE [Xenorhabdus]MBC8947855.1 cyd operon protein YbgE [Xenorhabdus sp. TS4]MBC8948743.1 cyd operon protein YbgE [Xenorhabdus sp. TS4]PHM25259.1 cyd operon protein YbgE [Xenorhabdus ehlersii]PHM26836.1 cyd operon protein YbgE [Xenorhabdus ehlersii]RKE90390.1 cyd operon protein YbgE [Xenorhabdus ehlersii]